MSFDHTVRSVVEEWLRMPSKPSPGFRRHLTIRTVLGVQRGRRWQPLVRLLVHRADGRVIRSVDSRIQRAVDGRIFCVEGDYVRPSDDAVAMIEVRTRVLLGGPVPPFDGICSREDLAKAETAARIIERFVKEIESFR